MSSGYFMCMLLDVFILSFLYRNYRDDESFLMVVNFVGQYLHPNEWNCESRRQKRGQVCGANGSILTPNLDRIIFFTRQPTTTNRIQTNTLALITHPQHCKSTPSMQPSPPLPLMLSVSFLPELGGRTISVSHPLPAINPTHIPIALYVVRTRLKYRRIPLNPRPL